MKQHVFPQYQRSGGERMEHFKKFRCHDQPLAPPLNFTRDIQFCNQHPIHHRRCRHHEVLTNH